MDDRSGRSTGSKSKRAVTDGLSEGSNTDGFSRAIGAADQASALPVGKGAANQCAGPASGVVARSQDDAAESEQAPPPKRQRGRAAGGIGATTDRFGMQTAADVRKEELNRAGPGSSKSKAKGRARSGAGRDVGGGSAGGVGDSELIRTLTNEIFEVMELIQTAQEEDPHADVTLWEKKHMNLEKRLVMSELQEVKSKLEDVTFKLEEVMQEWQTQRIGLTAVENALAELQPGADDRQLQRRKRELLTNIDILEARRTQMCRDKAAFEARQADVSRDKAALQARQADLEARQSQMMSQDKTALQAESVRLLAASKDGGGAIRGPSKTPSTSTAEPLTEEELEFRSHPWRHMAHCTLEQMGDEAQGTLMTKLTVAGGRLMYVEGGGGEVGEGLRPKVRLDVLMVRSQVKEVLDVIIKAVANDEPDLTGYTVLGIPGVGKSVSSTYLLKRCYDMGRDVVTHNLGTNKGWLLVPGQDPVQLNSLKEIEQALGRRVLTHRSLYLCDVSKGKPLDMCTRQRGVTVLTASPDPHHTTNFLKSRPELWVSPWTRAQLEVALPHILSNYDEVKDMVWDRFEHVGGTMRILTASPPRYDKHWLATKSACDSMTVEQLRNIMQGLKPQSGIRPVDTISHKVLHVYVTNQSSLGKQSMQVQAASLKVVEEMFAAWVRKNDLKSIRTAVTLAREYGIRSMEGHLYELYIKHLAQTEWRGTTVEATVWQAMHDGRKGDPAALTVTEPLPTQVRLRFTEFLALVSTKTEAASVELAQRPCEGLLVEAPRNWPGVDSWMYVTGDSDEKEIWLLQMTIASSHGIDGKGFAGAVQHARRGEWQDAKYRLVFVVPSRSKDKYITEERQYGPVLKQAGKNSRYIDPWTGLASAVYVPGAEWLQDDADRFTLCSPTTAGRYRRNAAVCDLLKGPDRLPTLVWTIDMDTLRKPELSDA